MKSYPEDEELDGLLINSDSQECNNNLSSFIKYIIDKVYMTSDYEEERNYHKLSQYALKLINSNLFVKNYKFCMGKFLAFLSTFTSWTECSVLGLEDTSDMDPKVRQEGEYIKEFLCIILLVLLKLKNSGNEVVQDDNSNVNVIKTEDLFKTLQDYDFITVISNFISVHVRALDKQQTSFVLFKFSCDIFFEYLYYTELLTDEEFSSLTNDTQIIPTLIKYLLANENFSTYDIDGDDFEDEDKLIAYEEFKLLLLINEQYLMKSYSNSNIENKVFNGLMKGDSEDISPNTNHANITGFINLLIYHLNREESQIIKILILKFLYLVFTTSYTTRLVYLNDLKILIDVFIRELNNMDFTGSQGNEHRFLAITYLKVMYPLLMFSQIKDLVEGYKNNDILELFENLILNTQNNDNIEDNVRQEQEEVICKLAKKSMGIQWLKISKKKSSSSPSASSLTHTSTSSSLNSLNNNNSSKVSSDEVSNVSTDSIVNMARVASVRTSSRSDYHKHTTSHNIQDFRRHSHDQKSLYASNNNNIFLEKHMEDLHINPADSEEFSPWVAPPEAPTKGCNNILDLPVEYLKTKKLPVLPVPIKADRDIYKHGAGSSSSVNSASSNGYKHKKPPPPPPQAPQVNEFRASPSPLPKYGTPPPPPPPPRRRR
ncbi:uncharacterized protein RJT21DRAFT_136327 [Scheffersomyces amazonensis]|uniref:uncharacterized protein n=1 Tax=Scheffersomyces amazonensis TaxID=1078765 RepID=UPI00315DFB45